MENKTQTLAYWKQNAEEDYMTTPISLLRYITEMEKALNTSNVSGSLHRQILEVIMENGFLIKQENWNEKQMEIRATYDAFRIMNLVGSHLSNDR